MDNELNHQSHDRPSENSKEWKLIDKALMSAQAEQKTARRWGIFFKALTFIYLFAILMLIRGGSSVEKIDMGRSAEHVAIIEVNGVIAADELASADHLIGSLRDAFDNDNAQAVILRINSPGGSPVQAGYVYDEIKRLKEVRPELPVYAVIMDLGASGAYYIAAAADEIYADKASLVGSIGVVAGGFGFVDAMDKLGVERRLYTAGEHKGFLDPFKPENPEEVSFWKDVLEVTHQQFIDQVKQGRGDRLAEDPKLFSGYVWTGEQAVDLGLVDGLSSSSRLAREKFDTDELVNYTYREEPWKHLFEGFGVSVGRGIAGFLTEQTLELR